MTNKMIRLEDADDTLVGRWETKTGAFYIFVQGDLPDFVTSAENFDIGRLHLAEIDAWGQGQQESESQT
jgi:hypothetical protein